MPWRPVSPVAPVSPCRAGQPGRADVTANALQPLRTGEANGAGPAASPVAPRGPADRCTPVTRSASWTPGPGSVTAGRRLVGASSCVSSDTAGERRRAAGRRRKEGAGGRGQPRRREDSQRAQARAAAPCGVADCSSLSCLSVLQRRRRRRGPLQRSSAIRRRSPIPYLRDSGRLLDQSLPHRLGHRRSAIGHPVLLVDVLEVGRDGRGAHVELLRDLARRAALRGQLQDLELARSELVGTELSPAVGEELTELVADPRQGADETLAQVGARRRREELEDGEHLVAVQRRDRHQAVSRRGRALVPLRASAVRGSFVCHTVPGNPTPGR